MKVNIINPEKTIFEGDASIVQLPGTNGLFAILKNHAPLIALLGKGRIRIVDEDNNQQFFSIDGGVVEVVNNKVLVLAD